MSLSATVGGGIGDVGGYRSHGAVAITPRYAAAIVLVLIGVRARSDSIRSLECNKRRGRAAEALKSQCGFWGLAPQAVLVVGRLEVQIELGRRITEGASRTRLAEASAVVLALDRRGALMRPSPEIRAQCVVKQPASATGDISNSSVSRAASAAPEAQCAQRGNGAKETTRSATHCKKQRGEHL